MSTAAMSAPLVELRNVSRWYGEVIGINRVTVELRPGITGLLGPNGCGKSTMMNLISGMMPPSQGEVLVRGRPVWRNPDAMETLGYCTQVDAFYERMTGFDFLSGLLCVRGYSVAGARRAAEVAMERVRMTPNMNRRIQSYSKGMRQRTKVALAIAHDPSIVILDEPLDGLDAVGRHEMIDLIHEFGKEGRSVLISSHILHEIEAMTNNILLLNGGYLLAEGDVREVRQTLSKHPHRILLRCSEPRRAALYFLQQDHIISAKVEEDDEAVVLETRDIDRFHEGLNHLVLEERFEVSLVTVADENISSIFGYLVGESHVEQQ